MRANGSRSATVLTGREGGFSIASRHTGPHRLEVSHLADRTGQSCLILYWNGRIVLDSEGAAVLMAWPTQMHEGVEYCRGITEAPSAFQDMPVYLLECPFHSVLALWSYTGHHGPTPDLGPSPFRLNLATGIYRLSGGVAPGVGPRFEIASQLPISRRTAMGFFARRSSHGLPADVVADLVPDRPDRERWPYDSPANRRTQALWSGGVEPRITLPAACGPRLAFSHSPGSPRIGRPASPDEGPP